MFSQYAYGVLKDAGPLHHVWSYDFVHYVTHDGCTLWLPILIDEHTRQCLAIRVECHLKGPEVIDTLFDAMLVHGVPEHIRLYYGPEMTSRLVPGWLERVGARSLFIEPKDRKFNGVIQGPKRWK